MDSVTSARARAREHIDPDRAALTRRLVIEMPFVHEEQLWRAEMTSGRNSVLYVDRHSPRWARNIAEKMARYFTRSTRYDGGIYYAADPGEVVVALLPAWRCGNVGDGTHYAGAVAVHPHGQGDDGAVVPQVHWIWVHPFERRTAGLDGLVDQHWPELVERWPGLTIDGPFTPAGRALARRLGAPVTRDFGSRRNGRTRRRP